MKILARLEIDLGTIVILRIDLIDARGCPQRAVDLQAQEVGNRPPLTHERLVPFRRLDQLRVIGMSRQAIFV